MRRHPLLLVSPAFVVLTSPHLLIISPSFAVIGSWIVYAQTSGFKAFQGIFGGILVTLCSLLVSSGFPD